MKKIFFIIGMFLFINNVSATSDNIFYYNDEKVYGMYIKRDNGNQSVIAIPRILKKRSDNSYIYCLEPFVYLKNDTPYIKIEDPTKINLTENDVNRINLLIYYGYGYKNHTNIKWYGITQYLIWKQVDPVSKIFFVNPSTNKPDDLYRTEINEIELLISNHLTKPNFIKDYVIDDETILNIESNIDLSNYEIETNIPYEIIDNNIKFNKLKEGEYTFKIKHINNRFNIDYGLYYHKDGQDVIVPGYSLIYDISYEFKVKVVKPSITLDKSNSITGEKLSGAVYGIYQNNKLIKKITTNKKGTVITNLTFGEYIIKEITPPKGYKLDNNEYKVKIDENNTNVSLSLVDDKIIIKIPDTGLYSNKRIISLFILSIGIIGLIYGKK